MFQSWQFPLGLGWRRRTWACQAEATGNRSPSSHAPLFKGQTTNYNLVLEELIYSFICKASSARLHLNLRVITDGQNIKLLTNRQNCLEKNLGYPQEITIILNSGWAEKYQDFFFFKKLYNSRPYHDLSFMMVLTNIFEQPVFKGMLFVARLNIIATISHQLCALTFTVTQCDFLKYLGYSC